MNVNFVLIMAVAIYFVWWCCDDVAVLNYLLHFSHQLTSVKMKIVKGSSSDYYSCKPHTHLQQKCFKSSCSATSVCWQKNVTCSANTQENFLWNVIMLINELIKCWIFSLFFRNSSKKKNFQCQSSPWSPSFRTFQSGKEDGQRAREMNEETRQHLN